jgi:hypothetical protein
MDKYHRYANDSYDILYRYRGYGYRYRYEFIDQRITLVHECIDLAYNTILNIPFSSAKRASKQDFQSWIDIGMPSYNMLKRNIGSKDLEGIIIGFEQ